MQYVIAVLGALLMVSGIALWNANHKLEACQKAGAVDAHEVKACGSTVGILRDDINGQNNAIAKSATDAAEIERKANERAAEMLSNQKRRTAPIKDAGEMNQWYERLRSSLR